jgi:TAT (twin-arginine translocation) pathway signal sequence
MSSTLNRRDFLKTSAAALSVGLSGVNLLGATKKTATDIVTLGKSGVKLSRLGIGTGSNNLVHAAFERGVTYIDTAHN